MESNWGSAQAAPRRTILHTGSWEVRPCWEIERRTLVGCELCNDNWTQIALLVATEHTYVVALNTSGSEDCTCRSRNVCCLCQSVCLLADGSCSAARQRRRFRLCGRASDDLCILHTLPPLSSDSVVADYRNSAYTCVFSQDFYQVGLCSCSSRWKVKKSSCWSPIKFTMWPSNHHH